VVTVLVNDVSLRISAVAASQYPTDGWPEIALVGRSNVGKSSLTNRLINRKALARTSGAPGKTRTLNFYAVENELFLVDVPGYGYAKVSKKQRAEFGAMIEAYLTKRSVLRGVVQLVDGRHVPTADDVSMYRYLAYYELPVLVVATKMDKVKRSQFNRSESMIRKTLGLTPATRVVLFSAQEGFGKDAVWDWIEAHMAAE
jgi:GTP-binding protein